MGTSIDETDERTERAAERTRSRGEQVLASDRCDDRDEAAERVKRAADRVERWRTRGWTTIVLERRGDEEWRATQDGVDVEGRGTTAAGAAAAYCRRVSGDE